jgi:hypothetical protein
MSFRTLFGHWANEKRLALASLLITSLFSMSAWLRGLDLNQRPLGYEPNELPDCSTPRHNHTSIL